MTANPGPPEQCYDDCPTNRTGDTEDCTCAGTIWYEKSREVTHG